jgi:hypothetical protein
MKRCAALALAALCAALQAYDWPLEKPQVTRSFGTPGESGFSTGIDLASASDTVKAVDSGDLVFYSEGTDGPIQGLGAWVAVSHDRNLVSVYSGLKNSSVPAYLKRVDRGSILGLAGDAGARTSAIRFSLFDREKRQWVNPYLFLDAIADDRAPQIRSVFLKRDAGLTDLSRAATVKQGIAELISDFGDPGPAPGSQATNAPFQVQVLLDGTERLNLLWDTAREKDGRLIIFGDPGRPFDDVLAQGGGLRLGNIPIVRGKVRLDIIVSDFARNTRTQSFSFNAE